MVSKLITDGRVYTRADVVELLQIDLSAAFIPFSEMAQRIVEENKKRGANSE